jgi:hypothetical protein
MHRAQIIGEIMKFPAPLLVSAIVESLSSHEEYSSVTFVVPGEAETFCVAAARSSDIEGQDITIFSDDSDVLVYQLHKLTRVAPFRDLQVSGNESQSLLSGLCHYPWKLAQSHDIAFESLTEAAFFMSLDPFCLLNDAFKKATSLQRSQDEEQYHRLMIFKQEYAAQTEFREWNFIYPDKEVCRSLCRKDARISELIHQTTHKGYKPGTGVDLEIFLPYLLEDASRTTAWEIGRDLRIVAYSALLGFANKMNGNLRIVEHTRSGSPAGVTATNLLLMPQAASLEGIRDLHGLLEHSFNRFSKLTSRSLSSFSSSALSSSQVNTWHFVMLHLFIQDLSDSQRSLPDVSDLLYILSGIKTSTATSMFERLSRKQQDAYRIQWWRRFHFAAQYEAMYYSLRILHQLLRASVYPAHITKADAAPPRSFITTQDNQAVMRLLSVLDTLPSIIDFSSPPTHAAINGDNTTTREQWEECLIELISEFQNQKYPLQSYHAKAMERKLPKPLLDPRTLAPATNQRRQTPTGASGQSRKNKNKAQPPTNSNKTSAESKNPYDLLKDSLDEG